MAKIIDGKKIAEEIQEEIKSEVSKLKNEGVTPGLAVILVGENPASQVYVKNKSAACEKVGIYSETIKLAENTKEEEVLALIDEMNENKKFHGILVQLPLPKHINESRVLNRIKPEKDVDGFHPVNIGKLVIGEDTFLPCTAAGIQQLLVRSGVEISGKHVVVVGRSNIVGKPIANILLQKKDNANATVTICHTGTKNMSEFTKQADILIVAAGKAEVITGDMIKDNAVVIDVGINRVEDPVTKKHKLVGDVHFESASQRASLISPVPGGVGPMTVTMLLVNTVKAAKQQSEQR
ncbi:MAG: bifunctional methylenetetrahydrofolate dehydrogenase/methenyltetrahydrofolate cyclohydrolase FolD [Candidatus Thermoplasmatota archaeon]|nr:bifunctional methylenetetrahydrofolate dehydrogenase/methenyltetrahydrofolate cyclohydrolase FolD [Candidatus Thermoplasmatota archaeon]